MPDHTRAWAELARTMMEKATTAVCHRVAAAVEEIDAAAAGAVPLRVALLTNYTAEPLAPLLTAKGVTSGLSIRVYIPSFDTWMQEIVDPSSGLRRFEPDVCVIDLQAELLCPALVTGFLALDAEGVASEVERAASVVADAVQSLRSWSTARILVHLPARPAVPSLGILDAGAGSQSAAFDDLHARTRAAAAAVSNTWCVEADRLRAELGEASWCDRRMWLIGKIPYTPSAMQRIADEHLRFFRAFTGRMRKVLVLDLDDTLWGGVLGERGPDGIDLGPSYPGSAFVDLQKAVLELSRRGVVLAINSANDADDVRRVLDTHPDMVLRWPSFAAARINWEDKAQNLVELADELGLGLDSFVFVDNSATECARVRQALPEVLTVHLDGDPSAFGPRLRQLGAFDSLTYGAEDRARGAFYRAQTERAVLRSALGSLDEYLASLETELVVEAVGPASAGRAADLTQRTNQFNMTTRRRTRDEILEVAATDGCESYVFALTDRFGEQGVIGFASLAGAGGREVLVTDFLLSCRVLKRRVEEAMLAFLIERAGARGAETIVGEFRPTARNAPFAGFYASAGFEPRMAGGEHHFVRPAGRPLPVEHVRVTQKTAQTA